MRTMEEVQREIELERQVEHHKLECRKLLKKLNQSKDVIEDITKTLRKIKLDKEIANEVYANIKSAENLFTTLNVELSFKPEYPL